MIRVRLLIWIGCALGAAEVFAVGLPPLPAGMPVDGALGSAGLAPYSNEADVDAAPVGRGGGLPGAATSVDDSAARLAGDGAAAASGGAGTEMLEGPPVPLAPAARMSDSLGGRDGESAAGSSDDDRPISLHLHDASLAAAFDAFARFTGLDIVVSEQVRGNVSLRLNNVGWRSAFDALLDANGLAMARRGRVIWVAPVAELAARERQRFEAHARAAELEPLVSRTFLLHYPRAAEVQRLLSGAGGQRILSKRGAVLADPRTNLLFVTDVAARVAQIADLVAQLDQPSRQVLIEARIVEGERGFSRHLGVRLALRAAHGGSLVDLSARPLAGFDAATAGLTLFAAGASRVLDLELSALEADGRGQIVSSPRVVTADRTRAIVEQGTELPYQAKVGNGMSGVQFRRATLKLEVEPQITPDGRVILDLDVAKDSVGEQTASGPAIHTKHVQTRVEVENGGTVSIGGIYASDVRDDLTRVPLLGKIPILGALFRHRAQREQRGELVVYITPRVVTGP
ncbi:type IV pilus secretin PilQ [Burkholderia alba]|uniref:type IV pilus secretin PilQ n=1 Tax=Burkholderia alba TaxID=2683677 RepID=UPI002B05996A|nr:secretin N-terminal domain-containing protein [Burkholderia alba]